MGRAFVAPFLSSVFEGILRPHSPYIFFFAFVGRRRDFPETALSIRERKTPEL